MRALKKETEKRNFKSKPKSGYQKLKEEDFYIETYVNLKRITRVRAFDLEEAIDKAIAKEEDKIAWYTKGYDIVDADANEVEEKDYETYRLSYKKI
jgi:hypothetical protein